jgi:hypothetical protein
MVEVPNPRYERKFFVPDASQASVLAVLRMHPAVFREAFPPRFVNSVYLDTASLCDYLDHVNGAPRRSKTRVRWYGVTTGPVTAQLEFKVRLGELGGKRSFALGELDVSSRLLSASLEPAVRHADLPAPIRVDALRRQSVLRVSYLRSYFVSASGHVRLTVDTRVETSAAGAVYRDPGVIVEVKYGLSDVEAGLQITSALPWRQARMSKYVRGVDRIRGGSA